MLPLHLRLFTCACPPQVWAGERALPVRASLLEVCTDQQLLPQMLEMRSRGASEATVAALDLTGMQTRVHVCLWTQHAPTQFLGTLLSSGSTVTA